jgi:hypothetical protein
LRVDRSVIDTAQQCVVANADSTQPGPKFCTVNATHLGGVNDEDQPWLLVGPQPGANGENVYVAYDDFNTAPDATRSAS